MGLPLSETRKIRLERRRHRQNRTEIPIRHLNGHVLQEDWEFEREVWTRDINLKVI